MIRILLGVYLVALVAAVLTPLFEGPIPEEIAPSDSASLFAMGSLADGVRNLLLFMPLGAALSGWVGSSRVAIAIAFVTSCAIELIQTQIPGRFSSPSDVLANLLGALIGAVAVKYWQHWLWPKPLWAFRLSLASGVAGSALLIAGGSILVPSYPAETYFGGWTLELGNLDTYAGRVLEARVGRARIGPYGPVEDSVELRDELANGSTMIVRAIAGPAPAALAPVITIHDAGRREILLIGVEKHDLVVRRHLIASEVGLEVPSIRLADVFADVREGEWVSIEIDSDHSGRCLYLKGQASGPVCWTLGRVWALFVPQNSISAPIAALFDLCLLALLIFPASFWARRRLSCWLSIAAWVGILAGMVQMGSIPSAPLPECLAVFVGAIAGGWCSRRSDEARLRRGPEKNSTR